MTATATAASADYDIRVAEDQLTATVRLDAGGTINAPQLVAQLQRAGIRFIDERAINEAAAALKFKPADAPAEETKPQGLTLVVARGQPPVEDVPERLAAVEKPAAPDKPDSHYERVQIETVNNGDAIAEVIPAVIGRDGVDVFARPIKRRRIAQPIEAGEGALREGTLMKASRAGRVHIEGSRIHVEPRLDIPTDVNFGTGNIRFDGDINIRGSVLDLFLVGSTADIHVGGTIEAAQVHAGADVTVGGGIAGKDKGQVTAGAAIRCRYISNGHIAAGADVKTAGEIANSRVITSGRLIAESGTILGSHVTANGGISCRTLGSPAFVKTQIEVGFDQALRQLARNLLPELNRCLADAKHAKDVIQPLLRDRKRLSVAERDKATELLFSAARIEQELKDKLATFRTAHEQSTGRCRAEVLVSDTLYPGVTLHLPGMTATVSTPFKGPLIIGIGGERKKQITITSESTGAAVTLATTRVQEEDAADLEAILQLAA